MRARSIFLSTVFCGGVMALTMIAGAEYAQAETLRPQGSWAVTKVAAKQDSAVPYCALARRFGNGSVLTFARNPSNETSVAVDFPRGTFTKNQNYTVQMDPGFGETRSFQLEPVSERGIVIRMGEDEKFYNALEQSGQLTIKTNDKSFVFSMPDMKAGTEDLAACIGQATEPAAGSNEATMLNEAAPMQSRASSDEVMDLTEPPPIREAEIDEGFTPAPIREPVKAEPVKELARPAKLAKPVVVAEAPALPAPTPISSDGGNELQMLQEENVRLRNALERERRQFENEMQKSNNSSAVAEMTEKLRLLEIENKDLRAKAGAGAEKTSKAEPVTCEADNAAQDQIVSLKAENAQLKSDIENQKQIIASLESDKKGLADAPVKNADAGRIQELQTQISRLEGENASLKSALSKQQGNDSAKANIATITQMKSLEAQLASMTADRNRLAAQIESIQSAEGDNRMKLSSQNWDLEQATRRYNEAEREIRRLGTALEQSRAKCEVEKKNLEYMLFDPAIAEKEQLARLIDLEEQLAQAKLDSGSKEQIAAYQGQVKDLEQKLSSAEAEMKQLRVNADIAEQKRAALEDQQAMVNGLKQEIATLNSKVEGQNKAQELEKKLAQAEGEMVRMRGAMEDADRTRAALLDQQDIVTSLKQEIATLNTQVASLQEENRKVSSEAVQKEMALKQEIAAVNTKLTAAQLSSQNEASLAAQVSALNAQISSLQDEKGKVSLDATQKEMALKQEIATVNAKLAEAQLNSQNEAALTAQIGALNAQLAAAQEAGAQRENALKAQIDGLNTKLATLQSTAQQNVEIGTQNEAIMMAKINELKTQLEAQGNKAEVIEALKQEINSLNVQVANLQSEKAAIATQMAQINSAAGANARRVAEAPAQPAIEVAGEYNPGIPMGTQKVQPVEKTPVAPVGKGMATTTAPAPAVASNQNLMTQSDMEGLLRMAGVDVPGVQKIGNASGNRVAYKWAAGGMYGNAEQRTIDSADQYEQFVQDYLSKTRSRCSGQFAAVPALVESTNGNKISSYEIACVDNNGSGASAALVFYSRGGTFMAVAHEAAPESMDVAMDARDKIISYLESSKLASR